MKHWNGQEQPLYYRPHSALICAQPPSGIGTPTIKYTIQEAITQLLTTTAIDCGEHSGKHQKEQT